jgi:hypothetical protein
MIVLPYKRIPVGTLVALVDEEDYERVSQYRWSPARGRDTTYAMSRSGKTTIYLHRTVLSEPPCPEVDHKDGNGLDNRKFNLRVATHQQNLCNQRLSRANTSGYSGVSWNRRRRKWVAQTKHYGKAIQIGLFDSKVDAALARDEYMRAHYGEYARLNFPEIGDYWRAQAAEGNPGPTAAPQERRAS